MAKTIPQLSDATTVNAADELIIQQGGITKRATATELAKGLNAINGAVNVKDFGALGDGVSDDRAAIQAALDAAALAGGGTVVLDAKSYGIGSSLSIASCVALVGRGSSQYPTPANVASANFTAMSKTRIVALAGFSSGPLLSVATASGQAYGKQGISVSGIMFDCAGIADRGIDAVTIKHCKFSDLLVHRAKAIGILEDVLSSAPSETNADTQFNSWDNITVWVYATGATAGAVGWRQTGTNVANVNQSNYSNIKIVANDGNCLDLVNCDSQLFNGLRTYSFGQGYGCYLHGSDGATPNVFARHNIFVDTIFGGAAVNQGTAQAGAASAITLKSAAPTTDVYSGKKMRIVSGTGSEQERTISAYDGSTKVATVSSAWTTTPDATSVYQIQGSGGAYIEAGTGGGASSYGHTFFGYQAPANGGIPPWYENGTSANVHSERWTYLTDTASARLYLENNLAASGAGQTVGSVYAKGNISNGKADLGRLEFFKAGSLGSEVTSIVPYTWQSGTLGIRGRITSGVVLGNDAFSRTDHGDGTLNGKGLYIGNTVVADSSGHLRLRGYTVATLPSAASAGQMIYVSDATGNKRLAVADSVNWRFPDGNIVS